MGESLRGHISLMGEQRCCLYLKSYIWEVYGGGSGEESSREMGEAMGNVFISAGIWRETYRLHNIYALCASCINREYLQSTLMGNYIWEAIREEEGKQHIWGYRR